MLKSFHETIDLRSLGLIGLITLGLVSLVGCGQPSGRLTLIPEELSPRLLSAWSAVWVEDDALVIADDAQVYQLASPLFSDYAQKLRTLRLPNNQQVQLDPDTGRFIYPVGTVITKTFYYDRVEGSERSDYRFKVVNDSPKPQRRSLDVSDRTLVETRVLIKRADGWQALPYVWNADQTEASLRPAGAILRATLEQAGEVEAFAYVVPNRNQCAGCHVLNQADRALLPIGPHPKNLNAATQLSDELAQLTSRGWLTPAAAQTAQALPSNVNWYDEDQPLAARARSYLDINCGHCHSATGPADTSGLYLDIATENLTRWGVCKAPIAAGQGTGGARFGIVPGDPDASIVAYRMTTTDPGAMMPELGRSVVHEAGLALVREWISMMPGSCDPDSSEPSFVNGIEQASVGSEVLSDRVSEFGPAS